MHTTTSPRGRRLPVRGAAVTLATATVLSTLACQPEAVDQKPAPAHRAASVQGLWRTDGYGTVVAIDGRRLRTYETTRGSCVPGTLTAEQSNPTRRDGAATFLPKNTGDAGNTEDAGGAARITVTPEAKDAARVGFADNAGTRTLRRIERLPEQCGHKPASDPRTVFDIFWQTYAENYPSFKTKGIDWNAVRDRYRPTITDKTTDKQLFTTLRRMIEPLHDAHTALDAGKKHRFAGHKEDTEVPTPDTLKKIEKATAESVGVEQQRWGQGAIGYADLPGRLGYLRITRFTHFAEKGGYAGDVAELDKALDAIFTARRTQGPHALHGLVIDLRFNGGGSDPLGLRIASRLTDRAYTAYRKRARDNAAGPGRFTSPQRIRVTPHPGERAYTGPVAVLTGPLTVSAGETFVQALMARTPTPARIGENTQGAFADTMERTLPNGWSFTLPNEQFLTADGTTFDGTGIPPTEHTPVFTHDEFSSHHDSALTRARKLLR